MIHVGWIMDMRKWKSTESWIAIEGQHKVSSRTAIGMQSEHQQFNRPLKTSLQHTSLKYWNLSTFRRSLRADRISFLTAWQFSTSMAAISSSPCSCAVIAGSSVGFTELIHSPWFCLNSWLWSVNKTYSNSGCRDNMCRVRRDKKKKKVKSYTMLSNITAHRRNI